MTPMLDRRQLLSLMAGTVAAPAVARSQTATTPSTDAVSLKVMSFNIRYGTANDGDNHWDRRKDFLVDVIRAESPDVLGVQEALYGQLAYILQAVPDYAMVGVGRDDGVRAGEYSSILYRGAALAANRSDTFWLSDTPERVASRSWGNDITRICTWAQFTTSGGRPLYVYNVHFDHQSQPSRERSAALLRSKIASRDPKAPVIVTGDFNAGEKNPAVAAMLQGDDLRDTFRVKQPDASPVGTFTGFKQGQITGEKIDYVFASREWEVVDAQIVRTSRSGRYPSDHFPVTAVLRMR